MRTYIYGVPQGFDFYEKDVQFTDYFKSFYISSRRGRRFLINRKDNGETIYTYLRYGMKEVCRQPQHAFFGMSVVMENGTYCPDFKIVLEYFEYLFERFVTEHSVIKQNEEGVLEYTVRKFEERPDDVDWLKTNLPNIFTAGRTRTEHYDSSFSMGSLGQVVSFVKPIGESQLQDAFRKYTWLSISSDIVDKPVLKEETFSQIELDLQELIQGLHAFNAFLLPIAANPTRENARDLEQIYRKVSEILLNLSRYVPTIEDAEENAAFRDVWGKYESLSGIIKGLYERTNSVADDMRHDEAETQYCYSCKRNKPLSEFESSEATICKECQKKKQVEERRLSSRVCVKCGKTKPVSAFSQTGGDVCNTCFHKNKAKEKKKKDEKKESPLEKDLLELLRKNKKICLGALGVLCIFICFVLALSILGSDKEEESSEVETNPTSALITFDASPTSDSRHEADREIDEKELQRLLDAEAFSDALAYVEGKPKAETFKGQMKQAFENKLWNIIVSSKDQQDKISKFYILNRDFMEFIGFGEEDKNRWEGICKDYNEVRNILAKKEISQREIDRGKTLLRRHNGLFSNDWNKRLNDKEKVLKDNEKASRKGSERPRNTDTKPTSTSTQPGEPSSGAPKGK